MRLRSHRHLPQHQCQLRLTDLRQGYELVSDAAVSTRIGTNDLLLQTEVIGLNPIDWKSPDYGYGIPSLPFVAGREAYGSIVVAPRGNTRLLVRDKVIYISTNYRDNQRATYQQYVVASDVNVVRIPPHITPLQAAGLGVAVVTAVLALGVCAGVDFSSILQGPDLHRQVRRLRQGQIASDIQDECLNGISDDERAAAGDWLVIWGASSSCASMANQLARLAGLRTILVLDLAKHADHITQSNAYRADLIVDARDPQRAIDIILAATQGAARFGLDCVGKQTAHHLAQTLARSEKRHMCTRDVSGQQIIFPPSPADSVLDASTTHLVGLAGLPSKSNSDIVHHSVPVKLFHEVESIGLAVVTWLERLLAANILVPPRVLGVVEGLQGINAGLDRMRRGEISGGRLVARVT